MTQSKKLREDIFLEETLKNLNIFGKGNHEQRFD
jgi:hypothetical protein